MGVQAASQMKQFRKAGNSRKYYTQLGALCWKMSKGKPKILLITSRETRRWVIPKGWPIDGLTEAETAAQEAWEEAGVEGRVEPISIGLYTYDKSTPDGRLPCAVLVYPLKVKSLARDFPETGERKREWFGRKKASTLVAEKELASLLRHFNPAKLPKHGR